MELSFSYDDTQIFDLFLFESAFLWFDIEIIFCKGVKYFMDVSPVLFDVLFLSFVRPSFGMDNPVVHEDGEPSQHHWLLEYSVHHHLECGW